jgi:hypothetical protein
MRDVSNDRLQATALVPSVGLFGHVPQVGEFFMRGFFWRYAALLQSRDWAPHWADRPVTLRDGSITTGWVMRRRVDRDFEHRACTEDERSNAHADWSIR